jgi:NADH-ubiquinone oxidoreductase chain 4
MLAIFLIIPLFAAACITTQSSYFYVNEDPKYSPAIVMGLFISTLMRLGGLIYFMETDPCASLIGFDEGIPFLGAIDYTSLLLVILSCFLIEPMLLTLSNTPATTQKIQISLIFVSTGLINAAFLAIDYIVFYVAFEAVLMPLYIMVGQYGGSSTRERSALLLFLYTLSGSLFMLLGLVGLYTHTGTTDILVLQNITLSNEVQRYLFICFGLALLVKTPIVPFHIWLPRAHADAPLAGSILLAGTVLKLATYAIYRLVLPILPDACDYFAPLVQTIAIISLIYSSLATIRAVDTKQAVAYSSVGHMAVVVLGLFSNSVAGITGAIVLSLAHGLISPALFALVGGVLYNRYHTRSIIYYRGIVTIMPLFSIVFFLAILANMGVPLSINWVGEFLALAGIMEQSFLACALGATGIVLSATYSTWLWARISTGSLSPYIYKAEDITYTEIIIVLPFIIVTVLLGIVPNFLLSGLEVNATSLLYWTS